MSTMSRSRVLALGLVTLLMAGCGSSGSTGPGTETKQTCTMTLGGAQSGSPACTVIGAIQTTSDGKTSLGFNGASADDSADVALFLPSAPVPGTYSNDNGGSAVILLQGTTTGWTAGGSTGSWSVTITSDSLVNSGAGLTRYRVHGSMSATLVQVSSGGADATLTVIF